MLKQTTIEIHLQTNIFFNLNILFFKYNFIFITMSEIIVVLVILLVAYLYYKYGRVCSDDIPNAWSEIAGFTKGATLLEADVNDFSKNYAKYSKSFIEARLDAHDEYTRVLKILKDAIQKGKRILPYKDVPHSPKMYQAFSDAVNNPDKFFGALASQTVVVQKPAEFDNNNKNVGNIGLHIVNKIRPQNKMKFNPPPPVSAWKNIERTRGPH